jgi:transcriptional regulator GlxA family with amidase domain
MTVPRILLIAFPDVQILDVTGPLEVFSCATRFVPGVAYDLQVASLRGGPVQASCGLTFDTVAVTDVEGGLDTMVVAGGRGVDDVGADDAFVREVQRLATDARRVTSVCTGAFVLAAAGLLDGRRATTHWRECADLALGHPQVRVDPDAIYVNDGNVWTSAGVTSGIDLALALLADDHGRQAAARIARQLVVYLRRSGGQAQFSVLLAAQSADREPIRELMSWMLDHLADDLSVPALAHRASLSERQFTRVFKAEVGVSPAEHVESVRLECACRLLETTTGSIEHVARTCGYGVPETMNRSFRRRLNITPGEHRRHFSTSG